MPARRFIVKGRVQQVGFRAYVLERAHSLRLGGQVWNTREGHVEIMAYSENTAKLDELEKCLWAGPGFVASVDIIETSGFESREFSIGPDC